MDGLFLGAAVAAAGQYEHFRAVAAIVRGDLFDLDAFLHRRPIAFEQVLLEATQHGFGRADDVTAVTLAQHLQIRLADHAAVEHPDALTAAVLLLHRIDDGLERFRIVAIALENFVAQRQSVLGDDQTDAHLRTIGSMIARMAALGHRIGHALAFEIRTRDIVDQKLLIRPKQLADAATEVLFQFFLEGRQFVHADIQTIGVHFLDRHAQKVVQGRAAIPRRLDVMLAPRPAKPRDRQNRRDERPSHVLAPPRHEPIQKRVQLQQSPQAERQPHVAERPHPLHAYATQLDPNGVVGIGGLVNRRIEQRRRRRRLAIEIATELRPAALFARLEFAEIRDDALPRPLPGAIRLDERPVRVNLSVFASIVASQEHPSPS